MAKIFIEESTLSNIGKSIRAKTGRTSKISPLNMPAEIVSIQTGDGGSSSSVLSNDATFYDYDGTVVASYSLEEVQALTSLPAGPSHEGLTFQGWNWSLEAIKSMYRAVNVGAIYTTNDGKTRIYITLGEGRTSPLLGCCPNGTVIVDWGDGTTPDTLTGTSTSTIQYTPTHNYTSPGNYVISLTVDGTCGFLGGSDVSDGYCYLLKYSTTTDTRNRYYQNAITKIEFGDGVTSIGQYAFNGCYSLTSITIPNSLTSIGDYAFYCCYSLTSITIPNSLTRTGRDTFRSCFSLTSITIPNSITSIGDYVFYDCGSLTSITIPDSVTSIGDHAFRYCHSLTNITIPDSVTNIGGYAFYDCFSFTSITIPNNVTSIKEAAFSACFSLTSIPIPDSVTSIRMDAFRSCYSITSITIPDSVTSIGDYAFYNCYGMAEYHLKPTTPPALSNTNAFANIPSDCIIYVPQGSLEAYQTATNWATYASYMQEETT